MKKLTGMSRLQNHLVSQPDVKLRASVRSLISEERKKS
jgi:hypothetical protein